MTDPFTFVGVPAVPATITDWLREDRDPADLYELLGRPRFDPRRQELLAAVRALYAQLMPYEVHEDSRIARRAVGLLRLLGRAEDTLSDVDRLRAHHRSIVDNLREACARAGGAKALCGAQLLDWLRGQNIHPDRLEVVARLLSPKAEETQTLTLQETAEFESEAADGLALEEPAEAAELVGALPAAPLPRIQPEPASRPAPSRAPCSRRSQRIAWAAMIGLGAVLAVLLLWVVLPKDRGETWQGELLELRGHDDEIHLLVHDGAGPPVEAFTPEYRFAKELADYWSADEVRAIQSSLPSGSTARVPTPSNVVFRGRRCDGRRAAFRLRPSAPLVELDAIQKVGDRDSLAIVGDGVTRVRTRLSGNRAELAGLLRIHPPVGETVRFPARFGAWERQSAIVFPSLDDRRGVEVEFAGVPASDFARFRAEDEVFVEAFVSSQTTPAKLVLKGKAIGRPGDPGSTVSSKGD